MFLALGSGVLTENGGRELVTFAAVAAMFHLFTHAFFKALLFMSAGSVMHAMGNVIDMRRFGGLRRVLPVTHATFLCGALALAGFPLLSGFWSKDEILDAAWDAGRHAVYYRPLYLLLWLVGLATAGLTGFYTFRAYFLTFWGEEKIPPEAHSHHAHAGGHLEDPGPQHHGSADVGAAPHPPEQPIPVIESGGAGRLAPARRGFESPPVMTVPLVILSVFALFVGLAVGPTHLFGDFLRRTPYFPGGDEPGFNWGLVFLSAVVALGGIFVAWLMYVRQPDLPARAARAAQGLYQLSLNKFGFDELYDAFVVKSLRGLALFCRIFDQYVIDSLVDLAGQVPRLVGFLFRPVQNGLVQFYALAMILGVTVFLIALVIK
jgi:NADH-quinone oxidoreductase subunit L